MQWFRQAMPVRADNRPTDLAAGVLLNFLLISAAAIARVHNANEKCRRDGFFCVAVP